MSTLTIARMLRLSLVAMALAAAATALGDLAETQATLRHQVLKLINSDRQRHGLRPVQLDPLASRMGDEYCQSQIRNRTTGHFTTDGVAPYIRYSLAGGNDGLVENAVAWSANYTFSERALQELVRRSQEAMMAERPPDDGHRRAILDPWATHVGVGLAWEQGEFRMVQEFVRRYIDWKRPLPRDARITDTVTAAGRPLHRSSVEAITVHFEPFPAPLTAAAASAIETYSLPDRRRDYLPRLQSEYSRREDGTLSIVRREYEDGRRGDFFLGTGGEFSFNVPFADGEGIYTVVVWARPAGASEAVAVTNVSIRVEGALQNVPRTMGGRH